MYADLLFECRHFLVEFFNLLHGTFDWLLPTISLMLQQVYLLRQSLSLEYLFGEFAPQTLIVSLLLFLHAIEELLNLRVLSL